MQMIDTNNANAEPSVQDQIQRLQVEIDMHREHVEILKERVEKDSTLLHEMRAGSHDTLAATFETYVDSPDFQPTAAHARMVGRFSFEGREDIYGSDDFYEVYGVTSITLSRTEKEITAREAEGARLIAKLEELENSD